MMILIFLGSAAEAVAMILIFLGSAAEAVAYVRVVPDKFTLFFLFQCSAT